MSLATLIALWIGTAASDAFLPGSNYNIIPHFDTFYKNGAIKPHMHSTPTGMSFTLAGVKQVGGPPPPDILPMPVSSIFHSTLHKASINCQ